MSGVPQRAAGFFLAPPAAAERPAVGDAAPGRARGRPRAGRRRDAAGGRARADAASADRAPAALVAVWGGSARPARGRHAGGEAAGGPPAAGEPRRPPAGASPGSRCRRILRRGRGAPERPRSSKPRSSPLWPAPALPSRRARGGARHRHRRRRAGSPARPGCPRAPRGRGAPASPARRSPAAACARARHSAGSRRAAARTPAPASRPSGRGSTRAPAGRPRAARRRARGGAGRRVRARRGRARGGAGGRGAAGRRPRRARRRAGDACGEPAAVRAVRSTALPNPRHSTRARTSSSRATRPAGRAANGARAAASASPTARTFAPVRDPRRGARGGRGPAWRRAAHRADRRSRRRPSSPRRCRDVAAGGGYDGPLAYRQGKPMRPDVALAFDRMERAARADGVTLAGHQRLPLRRRAGGAVGAATRTRSGWRRPGRRCTATAPSSTSGRASAYAWLARNARASTSSSATGEPWHYGYTLNPRSTPRTDGGDGGRQGSAVPAFVPARFAPMLRRRPALERVRGAARRPDLRRERLQPVRRQPGGAQGIAQFMPGTARRWASTNPFDPGRRSTRRRT